MTREADQRELLARIEPHMKAIEAFFPDDYLLTLVARDPGLAPEDGAHTMFTRDQGALDKVCRVIRFLAARGPSRLPMIS